MPRRSTYEREHPDCARAAAEARAELVAERDRLRAERDAARRWAVRLEQLMFEERRAAYALLTGAVSGRPLFGKTPLSE